jgi:ABC-type transporter Mla MlaB component
MHSDGKLVTGENEVTEGNGTGRGGNRLRRPEAVDGSSRAHLALARQDSGRTSTTHAAPGIPDDHQPAAAGELVLRREHRRDVLIIWLSGTLDRATAALLDRELDASPTGTERVVIDMTGLRLIDPAALDWLRRVHQRASQRGDRLSFRRGIHVARQPGALTRAAGLRPRWTMRPASLTGEDPYFALALACADVDHPRPGDRPWAA